MSLEREPLVAGRRVPHRDRPILAAAGGDACAVGAERHARDPDLIPRDLARSSAAGGIPEPHRAIARAGGGDPCAVGAERHVENAAGMPR